MSKIFTFKDAVSLTPRPTSFDEKAYNIAMEVTSDIFKENKKSRKSSKIATEAKREEELENLKRQLSEAKTQIKGLTEQLTAVKAERKELELANNELKGRVGRLSCRLG